MSETFYSESTSRHTPQTKSGFLQWNHSCDSLIHQVNSSNTISKVFLDTRIVNIGRLERILDSNPPIPQPGTVIMIDKTAWHVTAADGVVQISDFIDESGQQITPQTLADQCHIIEGKELPIITSEQAEWVAMVCAQAKTAQPMWCQRFAKFETHQIACTQNNPTQPPAWTLTDYQNASKNTSAFEIVVAWLIYIARDSELSQLQIGWDVIEYGTTSGSSPSLKSAKTIPFVAFIDVNDTFSGVLTSVKNDHEQFTNHLQCLPHALVRHVTHVANDLCRNNFSILGMSLIDTQTQNEQSTNEGEELSSMYAHGTLITLQINKENKAFRWIYDSNQMTKDDVNRISSRLLALLESAKNDCNAKVAAVRLNLLPNDEREVLLDTWNQTNATYTSGYLHEFFQIQVELNTHTIAVECDGETLTYLELNSKANQLAHYLISKGIKPDDRIALCVERSNKLIVAILSILKSGGAYVPLDPAYPSQRLTNILKDAEPTLLLADATGRAVLQDHQVPIINLDQPLPAEMLLSVDNPIMNNLGLTPEHLAYIIYTSGSTGTPKGVMIEHRNVTNCLHWIVNSFTAEDFKHTPFSTSINFDMSLYECFTALSMGTTLHVIPNALAVSKSSNISMLSTVPSVLSTILGAGSLPMALHSLHLVGEPLKINLINRIFENNRAIELCNLYGLTETSFFSTMHRTKPDDKVIETIGRPIANTRIYLLDAHGELVPIGSKGMLHIGGASVARGYLNHPQLTEERFLPDPFNEDNPMARMCCTGDLARYLPDGNLMLVGRVDQQVKIRGFRIELGEIEACLVEHPQVHEAAVQPFGNGSDTRLIAYVVVADEDKRLVQNLRKHLSTLLPDYMVPSAYVYLPSLPLTRNGKLDRRALPAPNDGSFTRQQYEAPKGELEEKLTTVWSELLNVERISRHDNFFELGGHSLLVVKLLARLRQIGLSTNTREVFNAPTLAMSASKLTHYDAAIIPPNLITIDTTEIKPETLPIINLSQADIDSIVALVPGGVANIQDIYSLTPLQSGMLYHHLKTKKGDPYLLVNRISFIDITMLKNYVNAMNQVVERHDILRTAIFWDGLTEPAQVVLRQVPSILSDITLDECNESVLDRLSQEYNPHLYKLDLTQAPLMRLIAAPDPNGGWVALQLIHHIIVDHSTLEILRDEIHTIMFGRVQMLKIPTPFRQFVSQTRAGINADENERFFTAMLGDIDEPTLPFGLTGIDRHGFEINEAHLKLSEKIYDQLRIHARNLHVNLASMCHLSWAQVISKSSGRESVVFGTVLLSHLRTGDTNANIMGPMINTLPLRLNIDEKDVETAVSDTHTRLSALFDHEYAPLVLAQRASGVAANLPLFNAVLNYHKNQTVDKSNKSLPGVSFLENMGQTNYPLLISLEDNNQTLNLTAQVDSRILAVRICGYMQQALKSLVVALDHTPLQPIRTLKVIPLEERTLLLHDWNQTTIIHSDICCLQQLFEAHVEHNGQTIGLECETKMFSYSEINGEANRLAHYLSAQGVKLDDRIAICVERSTTMIVAILGILKAGCAYVPLDPDYPSQRLTNILMDADPKFLLADSIGQKVCGNHQISMIDLEKTLPADLSMDNTDATKLGLTPSNLAYVIYTSGSTGTPKGVMVEHQQVVRLLHATHNKFDFNKGDKWCSFHSISFDASVWEMWGALSHGSQLSIVSQNVIRSTDEFYDFICNMGISILTQTPSAFKMFLRVKNSNLRFFRLRYILIGGEALEPFILRKWYETRENDRTILVNMYGPTEAAIIATSWVCDKKWTENSAVPIGRPLSNKRIYLLDSYGEPVPLGAEGEIYIGGNGLARGYLKHPEFTAERFLRDPFCEIPLALMYRTGDLARYLSDGNLVYLGRTDQQVKIRGFRIELGEIETRLVEHSQVHEAAVQPYCNGSDTRLIAYVVVADEDKHLVQNLRKHLLTLLPEYMVPSAYVYLPSLPLTSNGKLDRRALPAPNDEAFARQQYEAPKGELEEKLANIWKELLKIELISRHDNFFALGGHSLLVVALLAQLRQIELSTTIREVFDAPTLATLALTLACYKAIHVPPNLIAKNTTEIAPEMLPLITLSQADIDSIVAQVPGGVANIQDIYSLTPLQSGMLYHHLKAKQGDPYLLVNCISFTDITSLKNYVNAMSQVIGRHDILRTAVFWEGLTEPAQVVLREVPSILTDITLEESNNSLLEQLIQKFHPRCHRLDLTHPPLSRLIATSTNGGSWMAVHLMHHLISDHSTDDSLWTEVHAIMYGKAEVLKRCTPFRYFVAQVRLDFNQSEHTQFFTEMLGDIDEPTFPFGLSDVNRDGGEINEERFMLSQVLNDQLRVHARNFQVSLASICHLAWAQILAKASGCEAVIFGTVLLGRYKTGEGNNNIMGPMINTLPMRLNIDDSSIESAVHHTHARLSALLAHEHAPLVLAQSCCSIPTGIPLFSALLNYRHKRKFNGNDLSLPGITFSDKVAQAIFPLSLSLDDDARSLNMSVEVLKPISAARICAYMQQTFNSLVEALTNTPKRPIKKLIVIPPEERSLLLPKWSKTTVTHTPSCCLHHLFEVQVECDGHKIAVEYEGHTLSYLELNVKANHLAHYLIAQGVKPDDRIALCVERNTAMIVAILGILKAGCAYVPLEPNYPSQRLTNILLDADPIFLIADAIGRNTLGDHRISTIELEKALPSDLQADNSTPPASGLTPAHLAYIIYTSGSTGKPKGVMIEHQAVVQFFDGIHDRFDLNKQDKWCLFHSISFDMSVWEIFGALCSGSQLSIVPYRITCSTDEFYDWICTREITVLNQTSTALRIFIRAKNKSFRFDRLRFISFGAEPTDGMIVRDWYETNVSSQTMLVHMYGPTETIIVVTRWICKINSCKFSTPPIGYPLQNRRIYLLDIQGELALFGANGEIFIGGTGIARGYLNNPELTAERFLPDPFNTDDLSARMYRTGDLARYLPDGNLLFLGRSDQQVKIRGFRIELGEIEAHLVKHADVCDAVVQCCGKGSDAHLVAYVVTKANTFFAQNLRTYLSNLLPAYMVPAAYVSISSLPLTPSGKLDRRALPAPDNESFAHQEYEAPQGELEEKLSQIWRDLLNIDRVSRHDNFFALGGHSLLVVRLLAQLRQIELDANVQEVFDAPTLAMLASTLDRYKALTIPPNLIIEDITEITPEMLPLITFSQLDIDTIIAQVSGGVANIQDIYSLTPLQNGMLYHHLMDKVGDPYLTASLFRFNDRTSLERYVNAVQQVIDRHDILRTAFFWEGLNEPAQVVLRHVPSLLTEITLDKSNESVLDRLSREYNPCHYKLDLTRAPLLRLLVAPESNGSWVALQLMHHLIVDNLTLQRLQAEIHAIINGNIGMLKTPIAFRDFVAQTRLRISPDDHTRFFTEMLGDIDEPTLSFGLTDIDRHGFEINEAHLKLSETLYSHLRVHARESHVSLASICHLAWAQVIAKTSGRESVVYATVLLGRLQGGEKSHNIMGPMINTLPLRLDIDERSVEVAMRHTHAKLSALLTHEHASLVLAQRCSNIPNSLPLFNTMLNYRHNQNSMEIDLSLAGVHFISDEGRSNYPLTMSLDDNDTSLNLSVQVAQPISPARICAYMQQTLNSLVKALTSTPQQPIRKLNVLPPEEYTLLLHSWNQNTINHSNVYCIHQFFEANVKMDENAIAVEYEEQTISYSKLNLEANQFAHYLISMGAKPDDRIALCVNRSPAAIVGILGILKAGCAYVPLDPLYTSQRLTNILLDADPLFLVTDANGRSALGNYQIPMINLDEALPSNLPIDNPDTTRIGLTAAHLAYVIYTSGSTGTPKGVMVEHKPAVHFFRATHDKFDFNKSDKWCLFHSISFDISVTEIWSALFNEGQISIVSLGKTRSADEFYDWICSKHIDILVQTPSALKILMHASCINLRLDQLRYLIISGEALEAIILKDWYEKYDNCRTILVNMYGPTEAVMVATSWICDKKWSKNSVVPIGRPLSNKRIYLLDSHGDLVPIGAEGEIYIGGNELARGYLSRLELTAERFLPDPFSEIPSARMYRTGDLARYLPDGNLVYLGRTDQQVKIRGFRIELGEIEARLVEHPQVRTAVVQSFDNGSDVCIVAYVVVVDENKFLIQNLRAYLSKLLPIYMVPAAYICLPSLPLTLNGKLDRQALPAPDEESFARQMYEAPRGKIEEQLANIWRELLNVDRISRNDNFFELGGHSLLVMHFVNKAKLNNMQIDAHGVFSFPILKNLAEQISNRYRRFYCCDAAIPVRQYGNGIRLFLLPDGDGNISYAFELALNIDKNIPIYALPWWSPENKQPTSIEEMASAMIPLVKRVQPNGPCAIAGYSGGGVLAFEITKQLINDGYPVSFLGLIDTQPTLVDTISETEILLLCLFHKFSIFKTIDDSGWWTCVSKLTLIELIEEMQKINVDLSDIDMEWEILLTKQRYNYQNICAAYEISDSLPISIHLFKAVDFRLDNILRKNMDNQKKLFNCPKLGWENYNLSTKINVVSVNGDHLTMMTDPKNRSVLGKRLSELLNKI